MILGKCVKQKHKNTRSINGESSTGACHAEEGTMEPHEAEEREKKKVIISFPSLILRLLYILFLLFFLLCLFLTLTLQVALQVAT